MSSRLQQQPRGGEASRTQTEQGVQVNGGGEIGTLRLRPPPATNGVAGPSQDPQPQRRRVVWSEGTVDNEGLGRKSSKICCIYHKPKAFDESSDSDSSSSGGDDSSDSESDSSGHVGADRRQFHSDSDASSGPETDGPNLSSSLRRKKAHQHQHDDSSACAKHKMKKSTSRRTRGSTTQTVTVQDTDLPDSGQQNGDGEDDTGDSRQPSKPNAYERGPR